MRECGLCNVNVGPVIGESDHWRAVLNRNQNLLGETMLVLRRHAERPDQLTPDEWSDLQSALERATGAMDRLWPPMRHTFAFLQNVDQHVHLHVIPRYSGPQTVRDKVFKAP